MSSADYVYALLIDAAVKGLALVIVALIVVLALRKQAASRKHLVWSLAAGALVILPVLSTCLPAWRISVPASWRIVLPNESESVEPNVQTASRETNGVVDTPTKSVERASDSHVEPPRPLHERQPAEPIVVPIVANSTAAPIENGATVVATSHSETGADETEVAEVEAKPTEPETLTLIGPSVPNRTKVSGAAPWMIWLPRVWLIGVAIVMLVPVVGLWQVFRLQRGARQPNDKKWLALRDGVAINLGIVRRIQLLSSARTRMPLTWGVFRPVVLLPDDAESWDEPRRRMVLLHELAHVKRFDWLTQMIGQLACALHWFNPLVWFVARRMQVDREQACDDMVLAAGASPKEYAMELLHFASQLKFRSFSALAAVPMARQTSLEQRVRGIMDGKRRRASVTRVAMICGVAVCCCVLVPLAMMQAFAQEPSTDSGTTETAQPQSDDEKREEEPSKFESPKPVHLSTEGLSAFFVHDGSKVEYAFLYVGDFNSSTAFKANSANETWDDKATLKFAGREINFERSSSTPGDLWINKLKARLKNGRVFLIKQKLEAPNAQQVTQLDVELPMITKSNMEDVFARAHQPGYLPESKISFAGEFPRGSGVGRSVSMYSRHDDFRTRFAVIHTSGEWKLDSNDANSPKDGTWIIDTTLRLAKNNIRIRCNSKNPDELFLNTSSFDLKKGRAILITEDGVSITQRREFPRVLRTQNELLALYGRMAGIESQAVTLNAASKLKLPGGVTAEITRQAFHGADVMTKAILRWPAKDGIPALRYEIHIAADAFGNRDHWAAAWERGTTRLWIVNSGIGGTTYPNLRTIDFANPRRIQTWTQFGSGEFKTTEPNDPKVNARREPVSIADPSPRVPGEIMANLAAKIPTVRNLKSRTNRFGGKHIDTASIEEQFIIQGRVTGLDGKPIKGMLVDVFTEFHPTTRVIQVRTNDDGRYSAAFRMDLRTMGEWRGLTVKPLAAGMVDDDFARSGHLAMKMSADDEIKLSDSKKRVEPGQATTVNFVMQPAATIEGRIIDADGKPWANSYVGVQFEGQRKGYSVTNGSTDEEGRFRLSDVPTQKQLFLITSPKNRDQVIQLGRFEAKRTAKLQRLTVTQDDEGWSIAEMEHENPVRVRIVSGQKELPPPDDPAAFADNVIAWAESCRVNRNDILGFNPDVWDKVLGGFSYVHVALDEPRTVKLVGVDEALPITEIAFAPYILGPGAMYVKSGDRVVCLNHWTLEAFRPVIAEPALQLEKVDWYERLIRASRKVHPKTKKTVEVGVDAEGKLHFDGKLVDVQALTRTLQAAGHDRKATTVVLKTDPDVEVKDLHRPLWKLRTSRWEFVRIEFDTKAGGEKEEGDKKEASTDAKTSATKPPVKPVPATDAGSSSAAKITVRGVTLDDYPVTTDYTSIKQLQVPDPDRPGKTRPAEHLFHLTLLDNPLRASLEYAVQDKVFFISIYERNTLMRTYGPISGDPFERMNLMELMREMSPTNRVLRLSSMVQSIDDKLRGRAFELIPELPRQQFRTTYQTLRERVPLALKNYPRASSAAAARTALAWLVTQQQDWHARRVKAPDSDYTPGEPSTDDPKIVWNEPNEVGLRLGYSPAPWRNAWFYDDKIEMDVWVENVGQQSVKFTTTEPARTDEGVMVWMQPEGGERLPWGVVHWDTLLLGMRYRLEPKTRLKIKTIAFTIADRRNKPDAVIRGYTGWFNIDSGKYTMTVRIDLPGLESIGSDGRVNTPAAGEWIGRLTTKPLEVTVGEAPKNRKGKPEAKNEDAKLPRPEAMSMHETDHSAWALQSKDKVHLVLYSSDQLDSDISWTAADGDWQFSGPIHLMRGGKRVRTFEVSYSSKLPDHLFLDKQKYALAQVLARTEKGALLMSGRLLVLTEDLDPLNTGRTLALRNANDLKSIKKMAEMDLWLARYYRVHRKLDAMTGWVLSWNDQHPIKHSDGAHVARMRIFPDGRVIVADRERGLLTLNLDDAELNKLLTELRDHPAVQKLDKRTPRLNVSSDARPITPILGGHWDQFSSQVSFTHGDQTYALYYLSTSPSRRPQTVISDEAWSELSKPLRDLAARAKSKKTGN